MPRATSSRAAFCPTPARAFPRPPSQRVHPHVGASPTQLYHIVLYSMGLSCDIRFIHRDPLDPGSSSSPSSPRSSSHHNSGAAAAGFTVNEMAAYRVAHLHAFIRFQHDWFGSWLSALLARSRPESYHVLALTRLARLVDEQQLLPYEQLQLQLAQQQQQQQQHGQESEPPPGTGWHRAVQESAAAVPVEAAAAIEAAAAEVASVAWWHALEQEQESRIKGQQLELRDQQAQNGRPQGRGAGSGGGDPLTRFGGPGNDDDDDDDDHSDTDWLTGGRLQPLGAVARAPLRDSEAVRQAAALADVVLRPSDHQSELLLGRVSRALRLAAEQGLLAAPACSGSGSGDCSGWGAAGTGAGDAVGAEAAAVPLRRALAAAAARRLDSGLELLQTFMQTIMRANVTRDLVPFCRRLANALFTSFVREVKHGKAALGTDEIFAHLLLGSAAVSAEDCRRLVWDLVPEAAPAAPGQAQARLQARTPGGSGDGGGGNGDVGWGWNWTEALRLAVAEEQAPNWRKLVGLRPGGAAAAAANSRAIEGSGVGDGAPGAVQVRAPQQTDLLGAQRIHTHCKAGVELVVTLHTCLRACRLAKHKPTHTLPFSRHPRLFLPTRRRNRWSATPLWVWCWAGTSACCSRTLGRSAPPAPGSWRRSSSRRELGSRGRGGCPSRTAWRRAS